MRCVLALLYLWSALPAWAQPAPERPPIVVQGAMASETEYLISRLENAHREQLGVWQYWLGTIDGYPVVVSRTHKGTANAAASTMLAIEHYKPLAIVNQGTSGGHDPALHVYDIVVGTSSVNIGAYKTPYRPAGAGSAPLGWEPRDLTVEGSAGSATANRQLARFVADAQWVDTARRAQGSYKRGRVVEGIIGSSDMWIDEVDYVNHLHETYGTSVEEMETAAAAQVAAAFKVPFVGIRILSDNITNHGTYDPKTGEACQEFVYAVLRARIAALR
jgi:adenosylhomocysteine nucleosidase